METLGEKQLSRQVVIGNTWGRGATQKSCSNQAVQPRQLLLHPARHTGKSSAGMCIHRLRLDPGAALAMALAARQDWKGISPFVVFGGFFLARAGFSIHT